MKGISAKRINGKWTVRVFYMDGSLATFEVCAGTISSFEDIAHRLKHMWF